MELTLKSLLDSGEKIQGMEVGLRSRGLGDHQTVHLRSEHAKFQQASWRWSPLKGYEYGYEYN